MSGHFIVCGMGNIGYRLVELLHRLGEKVTVITEQVREERLQTATALGVRVIPGDARDERLLLEAGLAGARAVIAATDKDLVNVEIALDAHRLRPDIPVVIRLFDQDLAHQLETALDIRRALGMSALAAPSFAAAALGDSFLASFSIRDVPFVVGRFRLTEGHLAGCTTAAMIAQRHELHTLALERSGQGCIPLPDRDEALQPGDRLALFGTKEDWERLFGTPEPPVLPEEKIPLWRRLQRMAARGIAVWREEPLPLRAVFLSLCVLIPSTVLLFRYYLNLTFTDAIFYTITNLHGDIGLNVTRPEIRLYEILLMILGAVTVATLYSMITDYVVSSRLRKLLVGKPMPKKGHVVVVGMGSVGYQVVLELQQVGVSVVAVDADPDAPFLATVRTLAPVLLGDARLDETLERAGLSRARALVAATSDDSINLGVGLAARRKSPTARIVVRLFDAEFARKVENALEIDAALGEARIAAPTFAASALFPDVAKAFIIQDRLLVLRLVRAAQWAGRKPSDLRTEGGIHILMRGGKLTTGGAAGDESPLTADEEILALLWRELAPPWSEHAASPCQDGFKPAAAAATACATTPTAPASS